MTIISPPNVAAAITRRDVVIPDLRRLIGRAGALALRNMRGSILSLMARPSP
jgi:hypothetical protein